MTTRRPAALATAALALAGVLLACGLGAGSQAPEEVSPPAEPASEAQPAETRPPAMTGLPDAAPLTPATSEALPGLPTPGSSPAINERRRLTLEYPVTMRLGDATRVRLRLEMDDLGNLTPTALVQGNLVTGEVVEIPDLYATHNVVAEARLDMAGMQAQPSQTISEPLSPGKAVTFYWSVRPSDPGLFQGSVWLHLRFTPKAGGQAERIPVSVQFIDMRVDSLFGVLTGSGARGLGALGSALGTILGFPFLEDALKWIWVRGRRQR